MIIAIENLMSLQEVNECRTLLEKAPWVDGKITAGHQSVDAKNNLQLPTSCDEAKYMARLIESAFKKNPLAFSASLPKKILPPMFNCYQNQGAFDNHIDNAIRYNENTDEYLRTDISCTVFFTNPEEYEGGELIIQDTYGTQSIKLPAGYAILYPSTSLHRVMPVTKGARISSFFWIQSFVASDAKRRILFELDESIQSLSKQFKTQQPDVIQLTGVYHNLLREWSDM